MHKKRVVDLTKVFGCYLIELTQNQWAKIDSEDLEKVMEINWYTATRGRSSHQGYAKGRKGRREIFLHHWVVPRKPGYHTDHRNGDTYDNRKFNLRYVLPQDSALNKGCYKTSSTKVKGVYRYGNRKKFRAKISYRGRRRHLGCFATVEEAKEAYDKAAEKLYGEFRRTDA